jgi:cytochrome c peroxidase
MSSLAPRYLLVGVLAALAIGSDIEPTRASTAEQRTRAAVLFAPIEPASPQEVADPVARLGQALFWDTRLSADGKTACASCHAAADWGSDARPRSPDARGKPTRRSVRSRAPWGSTLAKRSFRYCVHTGTRSRSAEHSPLMPIP